MSPIACNLAWFSGDCDAAATVSSNYRENSTHPVGDQCGSMTQTGVDYTNRIERDNRRRASMFSSRMRRAPLVLEAFCFLTAARFAVALLPFHWITKSIATPPAPRQDEASCAIRDVRHAVATAVRRLAPSAVCLPQALAGHWMLYRRGIPSSVCFGARRGSNEGIQAHAWLRAGDRVILGEKTLADFTYLIDFPLREPATE